MWQVNLLSVVCLAIGIPVVFSLCPQEVFHGDKDCKDDYSPPPNNTKLLLDTYGFEKFPSSWTRPTSALSSGSRCTRATFLCSSAISAEDCFESPEVNVFGCSEVLFGIELNSLCIPNDPNCQRMNVCGSFSNDHMNCSDSTGNISNPVPLGVPASANTMKVTVCPYPLSGFGFYCVDVVRMMATCKVCSCRESGLVSYPEKSISAVPEIYYASCKENAHNTTSLEVTTDGCKSVNDDGIVCVCNPGYEEINGMCNACEPNYYNPVSDGRCLPCPRFSGASGSGSTFCQCQSGFYRTSSEPVSASCSRPPSVPRVLTTRTITSTSIGIRWTCPTVPGRNDVYYTICHRVAFSSTSDCTNFMPSSCINDYTIEGLQPATTYEVFVTSNNGVSDNELENEPDRTVSTTATTEEDVPGAPVLKRLCTVVIWKPPAMPNGVILGYQLRFLRSSGEEVFNYSSTDNFHLTTERQREENVLVQIRVCNSKACSAWIPDPPMPIDCTAPETCAPVSECVCESESTTESFVATEKMTTEASTTEEITSTATTTEEPTTTEAPTTVAPTTEEPTTVKITTETTTTEAPTTTEEPTTEAPTTSAPTTEEPTTEAPTTSAPTTAEPTTAPSICSGTEYPACDDSVYFQLHGSTITSADGENIKESTEALQCWTSVSCCKNPGVGEFIYPNGDTVGLKKDGGVCYRNRSPSGYIRLNCKSKPSSGEYGCIIPDSSGQECCKAIYIN